MNDDELDFKLKEEVRKAQSMRIACDDVLNGFFEAKTSQLFGAFVEAGVGDPKQLEGIHHACKALQSLQLEVQGIIDSGKLAAIQLENIDNNH